MKNEDFSIVLIAKNEENVIGRLLEAVKDIEDKVVLDTGSTDKTVEIAKSYGCNVIEVGDKFCYSPTKDDLDKFQDLFGFIPTFKLDKKYFHFADARNEALKYAKNDWCFQPDADEIPEWDIKKIREVLPNEDQLVYRFVFSWKQDGTPGLEFTHCKFFRKSKIQWTKWVHEVPTGNAKPPRYVDFIYHKHYQEFKESRSTYLPALELSVIRDPEDERNLFYLGREYIFQGEYDKSIKFFERCVSKISWLPEKGQAYTYIGDCYKNLGDFQKAKENYLNGLKYCDTRREPWFALGELLSQNHPDEAIPYYMAAYSIPFTHGKHGYFNDMNLYGYKIPERIAAMYGRIGDFENSKKWWLKSTEYDDCPESVFNAAGNFFELPSISILCPTLGREEGLKRLKQSIENLNYPKNKLEILIEEDEPRIGVPKRMKKLYEKSNGKFLVFAANDTEFTRSQLMIGVLEMISEELDLLAFNTGEIYPDKGNICEHFMIRRDFVEKYLDGEIFNTEFNHCGVDNLLWAQVNKYGKAKRSMNAKMIHNHFSRNQNNMDEIYKMAYSKAENDRLLLEKKLIELHE